MPENELLPKTNNAADWNKYADNKRAAMNSYLGERWLGIGPKKNSASDPLYQTMAANESMARQKAKQLSTPKALPVPNYAKGGKVRKTGLALLHKGETVIPASGRKQKRKTARNSGRY